MNRAGADGLEAMMRVTMDGIDLTLERATLAAAIAAGAEHAERVGRIVLEIRADGVALTERDIEGAPDTPGTFKVIELVTASRTELATEVLEAAVGALDDLVTGQRHVASQILATKLEMAVVSLQEILGVWQHVREALDQVCFVMGTDLPGLAAASGRESEARELVARLTSGLSEIRRCVGAQDWSTLADVLNDEMGELAAAWRGLVREIAGSMAGR
jgi:HAMP domain-containing protein